MCIAKTFFYQMKYVEKNTYFTIRIRVLLSKKYIWLYQEYQLAFVKKLSWGSSGSTLKWPQYHFFCKKSHITAPFCFNFREVMIVFNISMDTTHHHRYQYWSSCFLFLQWGKNDFGNRFYVTCVPLKSTWKHKYESRWT